MVKWNPRSVLLKSARKEDKQKILSELARILYAHSLATDNSKSSSKESSKAKQPGESK